MQTIIILEGTCNRTLKRHLKRLRAVATGCVLLPFCTLGAPQGTISTVVGNGAQSFGGDGGPAANASLNTPQGVAVDRVGNLFIADTFNHRIRRVDAATGIISTIAGNGIQSSSGDGGAATNASLNSPSGVVIDSAGNLFIAEWFGSRIRRVDAGTGVITTVAGGGSGGDGEAATNANLSITYGLAIDNKGDLFIADVNHQRIRFVDAPSGLIRTVAGNGTSGFTGDGGQATNASLSFPVDVAADAAGNLFISDQGNLRVRRVDATGQVITTFAGAGASGFSGDGGAATNASFNNSRYGLALDGANNLLIADQSNQRVRRVEALTGLITTIAGNGTQSFSGDGGQATNATLSSPVGLAVDEAGNIFIADAGNHRIRRVDVGSTASAPPLGITKADPYLVLSWPAVFSGFHLEATTNFGPAGWFNATSAPVLLISDTFIAIDTIGQGSRFYRLKSP